MKGTKRKYSLVAVFASLVFCTLPKVSFGAWTSSTKTPESSSASYSSQTVKNPVCYNNSTGTVYHDIKKAVDSASSGQYIYMYIGAHAECTQSIEIKNNVHLVLPFYGKHYDTTKTGTNIGNSPLYKISSSDDYASYGNKLGDENATNVSIYRSCSLTMKSGADITVTSGGLHIGGACSTAGNNGYYSELILCSGSSLTFQNGTTFDCFGYVKESSTDYSNPLHNSAGNDETKINNELDSARFIEMKSGSTLNSFIATYDTKTAGDLTALITANQCPFWEYDFPAIQTFLKINAGCSFNGSVLMVGPNSLTINKDMPIIRNSTSVESLFYLTSGYITIEYLTTSPLYSSRAFNARHSNFVVCGAFSIGYLYAQEGNAIMSLELDTRNCFLPINCRISIYIKNGFSLTTDKMLKFLAGSKLVVEEGGTFIVNNKVAFHKSDTILYDTAKGIYYRVQSTTTISDAKLIVNGTLTFNTNGQSNGAIAAYIEHNTDTTNAVLNMDRLSSDNNLMVSYTEGAVNTSVVLDTDGPFENGDGRFTVGAPYTSTHSGSHYYWAGTQVVSHTITVNIASSSPDAIVLYSILNGQLANGSDAVETTLANKSVGGTTTINHNYYMKIDIQRGISAEVRDTNNNLITSNYTDIILVDKDLVVTIVPVGSFTITFTNLLKDGASSNGRGHVQYKVFECETSNGTFEQVYETSEIDFSTKITQGKYFKVHRYFDGSDSSSLYNYFENANTTITKDPNVGSASNWNQKNTALSPAYYGDANYTFTSYWTYTGGCVLPDTMVMVADGTTVRAEELHLGDLLKTWSFETGGWVIEPIIFLEEKKNVEVNVIKLVLENDEEIEISWKQGFFDTDKLDYFVVDDDNFASVVGRNILVFENSAPISQKIVSSSIRREVTSTYEIHTGHGFQFVANNILTIEPLINEHVWFDVTNEYKYDEYLMQKDLETYGVLPYEVFADYVTEEQYDLFNGKYLAVPIGKGYFTFEELIRIIEQFLPGNT